jgi:hypothetical protein
MPFCPECKYEYRAGITTCPDCDVALIESLPVEPEPKKYEIGEDEHANKGLVSIYSTNDEAEAAHIKELLEASGIEAMEQSGMTFYGKPLHELAYGKIFVFESDAVEARRIIELAAEVEEE